MTGADSLSFDTQPVMDFPFPLSLFAARERGADTGLHFASVPIGKQSSGDFNSV